MGRLRPRTGALGRRTIGEEILRGIASELCGSPKGYCERQRGQETNRSVATVIEPNPPMPPGNVEKPAWHEGYNARIRGVSREDNPYANALGEDLWDDGWLFADAEIARGRAEEPKS
jgi:ribosome modulation factor